MTRKSRYEERLDSDEVYITRDMPIPKDFVPSAEMLEKGIAGVGRRWPDTRWKIGQLRRSDPTLSDPAVRKEIHDFLMKVTKERLFY